MTSSYPVGCLSDSSGVFCLLAYVQLSIGSIPEGYHSNVLSTSVVRLLSVLVLFRVVFCFCICIGFVLFCVLFILLETGVWTPCVFVSIFFLAGSLFNLLKCWAFLFPSCTCPSRVHFNFRVSWVTCLGRYFCCPLQLFCCGFVVLFFFSFWVFPVFV
jgi:hypothetical protein